MSCVPTVVEDRELECGSVIVDANVDANISTRSTNGCTDLEEQGREMGSERMKNGEAKAQLEDGVHLANFVPFVGGSTGPDA